MWGLILSEPLIIVALVGRYPTNKLIIRMPIRDQLIFTQGGMPPPVAMGY